MVLYTDDARLAQGGTDNIHIHALRVDRRADIVSLIVNNSAACGIGYLLRSLPILSGDVLLNVVSRQCAAGNLSLAHEFGHNMGLEHDRGNAAQTPVVPYAYGYQVTKSPTNPDLNFRTVMAYDCDNDQTFDLCPRKDYFSNPRITYFGDPMGIDHDADPSRSADNARALGETICEVSSWLQRCSEDCALDNDACLACSGSGCPLPKECAAEYNKCIRAARGKGCLSALLASGGAVTNGLRFRSIVLEPIDQMYVEEERIRS